MIKVAAAEAPDEFNAFPRPVLGNVFVVSGDEKGDRKASHRKHTDRANWKRGKFEGRSARTPSLGVS
jgi:hypothetical protein